MPALAHLILCDSTVEIAVVGDGTACRKRRVPPIEPMITRRGEHAMRHASANHASSYWLAALALCIGVLPAGATFAQQEHFPPTAIIVSEKDPPGRIGR
jgi:hypothetical protein